jgi:hypothetical protein
VFAERESTEREMGVSWRGDLVQDALYMYGIIIMKPPYIINVC